MGHTDSHAYHPNYQLPAHETSVSLVWTSLGSMCSGEFLDHLAVTTNGNMALPALSDELPASRKPSVSAPKRAQRASFKCAAKMSATFRAQFAPSEPGMVDSAGAGRKMATSMCARAEKGRSASQFLTEKQRRESLNEKYQVLRSLIPNPTKADRASIVQDAIHHVNELKERVEKLQVEIGSRSSKRRKVADDGMGYSEGRGRGEARSCKTEQHLSTGSKGCQEGKTHIQAQMMSTYGTGIEVRIVDDEATIKVTHHRLSQDNFLLMAVQMLQEAQLELLHVNGARIGNHNVYMLNVKIAEGNDVGATHIAKQLLERFDAYHASAASS